MDEDQFEDWLTSDLEDIQRRDILGMRFLFVGPERMMPFVTFVSDDQYDSWSGLGRPGVLRLNVGIGGPTFRALFPDPDGSWDWTALDTLMPHPDYARQRWVCIVSPSESSFETLKPLLVEAHGLAAKRAERKAAKDLATDAGLDGGSGSDELLA
jgi:hypothetical protein